MIIIVFGSSKIAYFQINFSLDFIIIKGSIITSLITLVSRYTSLIYEILSFVKKKLKQSFLILLQTLY